jgi:hypothetical protein
MRTPALIMKVHYAAAKRGMLSIWTVYDHPSYLASPRDPHIVEVWM